MVAVGSFFGSRIRAAVTLTIVAPASFAAAACGPDDAARTPDVSPSTAPVTDEVFGSQTSDVIEMADRSGGQACDLTATSPLLVSPPDNARQRQLFADALAAWTAAAAPSLDPADSNVLQESVARLQDPTGDDADADLAITDARAAVERFIAANESICSPAISSPGETIPAAP